MFPEAVRLNRNLAASIECLIHIFCWQVRPRQALLCKTVILLAPWKQSGANVTPARWCLCQAPNPYLTDHRVIHLGAAAAAENQNQHLILSVLGLGQVYR